VTRYDATLTASATDAASAAAVTAPAPAVTAAAYLPLARPRRCVVRPRIVPAASGAGRAGGTGTPPDDAARRFHVFDGHGEMLGSFTDWDSAHAFAHEVVALPRTATPVEVDDRRQRLSRRVWAHRCEFVTWTSVQSQPASEQPSGCDHPPTG
jgi:hypothetical protein